MLEIDVKVLILLLSSAQHWCIASYTELSFLMPAVTQFAVCLANHEALL